MQTVPLNALYITYRYNLYLIDIIFMLIYIYMQKSLTHVTRSNKTGTKSLGRRVSHKITGENYHLGVILGYQFSYWF